jgi:hypothetical protein
VKLSFYLFEEMLSSQRQRHWHLGYSLNGWVKDKPVIIAEQERGFLDLNLDCYKFQPSVGLKQLIEDLKS